MAKNKNRRRHSSGFVLPPLLPIMGMSVPVIASYQVQKQTGGGISDFVSAMTVKLTGFSTADHKFHFNELRGGAVPIIAGFAGHWLAGRIGINRMLGRYKIPIRL